MGGLGVFDASRAHSSSSEFDRALSGCNFESVNVVQRRCQCLAQAVTVAEGPAVRL